MSDAAVLETRVEWADREERFGAFVASHRERACRLAWRLVGGDEAAAEDVTQEAFVLVPMEGFTLRETAELLGRAEGTVKGHLHRALRTRREELDDVNTLSEGGLR